MNAEEPEATAHQDPEGPEPPGAGGDGSPEASGSGELETIRRARLRLMEVLEPQDSLGMLLISTLGPVRAAEIATGSEGIADVEVEAIRRRVPESRGLLQEPHLERSRQRWAARARHRPPERLLESLERIGAWFACPEDPDWPESLRGMRELAPIGLWGRGDRGGLGAPAEDNIAFVGCRDSTSYGESVVSHLAGDLAAEGYGVLSGAAFGIDAAAHRAALAASTRPPATVAYLACGIDRAYPQAHAELLQRIEEEGMILSEVVPGGSPLRHRFLQRNRLIAAMAAVTVVVEARLRSGALNTANHALGLGRTVAAVPGSVFSAQSGGCNRLLREGYVRLVATTQDLRDLLPPRQTSLDLGELGPGGRPADGEGTPEESLTEVQRLVKDALPVGRPVPADRLCAVAGLGIREALVVLAQLEGLGLAERAGAGWKLPRRIRDGGERP
jgi:DNA processing protein